MAHLYRLGACLLLVLTLGMIWTPAHASFPATQVLGTCTVAPCYEYATPGYGSDATTWRSTKAAACSIQVANLNGWDTSTTYVVGAVTDPQCHINATLKSNGQFTNDRYVFDYNTRTASPVAPTYSCPSNSTLSGSQCTCTPPNVQNSAGNACVSVDPMEEICKNNAIIENSTFSSTAQEQFAPGLISGGLRCGTNIVGAPAGRGCQVDFQITGSARLNAASPWRSSYVQKFTGAPCTVGGAAPDSAPAAQPYVDPVCARGSMAGSASMGGINVVVCTKPIDSKTVPKVEAKKENAGTPAETTTEKQKETICTGPSCTTTITTTVKDASGSTTSTTSSSESAGKADFCKQSPSEAVCAGFSGSWQGDCAAGFKGEGDPVLVAMAREVHIQNCKMNSETDEAALYASEKAKTGNQTTDLPGNGAVNISSADFDQSNALGVGAACIGNKSVTVMGATVILPFSDICPWLQNLGFVLMGLSALLSARIVTRG